MTNTSTMPARRMDACFTTGNGTAVGKPYVLTRKMSILRGEGSLPRHAALPSSYWLFCSTFVSYFSPLSFLSNSAVITTINHDEVWFKRVDGSKSKLYISQLQKGKYTIKHVWSTHDLIRCHCGSLKCLIVPFYVQYIMI